MDYQQVEKLFDVIVEYFHLQPPPEEQDAHGEWVRVRDGLQGADHCIRVLTPEEFDDWHRCLAVPIQVEFGRRPVAFCSYEGNWWVIYDDTDESEVIARFEKCFEGIPRPETEEKAENAALELSRFFGIVVSASHDTRPPSHFHVSHESGEADFTIVAPRLLRGVLSPKAAALVVEWATLHEKELLEAWESHVAGEPPAAIEPLQ